MPSIFHLNTDQITSDFIEKIKSIFPHMQVEIIVQEKERANARENWAEAFDSHEQTEDEKLFSSIVNEADGTEWTW
jgi:predicted negative regulator of RcsB-dependent stress response